MNAANQSYLIPRRPLLLLAAAMLFTVPAMFGNLAWWVPSSFLGALVLRFIMDWRGAHLRSLPLKVLLMLGGTGAVALSYNSLIGPEPGLSICLVLIGVKILEAHTGRDFHVLAALGWFASLAQIIITQSLNISICSGIAFVIVLAAVMMFHRSSTATGALLCTFRDTGVLLLQSVPLVVALFFFFPRGNGGLGIFLRTSFGGQSGMSDTLSPGSISSLALSNKVAFRAVFPEGGSAEPSGMYWRGGILTEADGLTWTMAKDDQDAQDPEPGAGNPIRQRILLQPHGGRWIFALDRPTNVPRGMFMSSGNVLFAKEPVQSTLQYEVLSQPNNQPKELPPFDRRACLQLKRLSPAVQTLALSWKQGAPTPNAIVEKGLEFFKKGKFRYTLTPGKYGKDDLEDFLFRRRAGFCEHYAAGFATLMRAAGIPARIVIGYNGGEYNALGRYMIVRQFCAHAWCEVWLPGTGWKRVDPTSAATAGGAADRDAFGSTLDSAAWALRKHGFFHNLQLAWDMVSYEWDSRVAGFDEYAQQSLFMEHGFDSGPIALLGCLMVAGAGLLGLQWLLALWKSRPRHDPLVLLYEQFCQRAGVLGAERQPCEGPLQFAQRAAESIPSQSERIRRIAKLYIDLRYSARPEGTAKEKLAREVKLFCRERVERPAVQSRGVAGGSK